MIQVHLFSDKGAHTQVIDSVESQANVFFAEQEISREELVQCQLAMWGCHETTEACLLVVVDIEPEITEEQIDAVLRERLEPREEEFEDIRVAEDMTMQALAYGFGKEG